MSKKNKYKELECLFCWAVLFSNGKNLAKPVVPNQEAFNKTQKQILTLKAELID